MLKLIKTAQAINSNNIKQIAKEEIQKINKDLLPLQQGLSLSSYVGKSEINVVILNIECETDIIKIKAGVFYTGIIAGCSCSDDPSPTDEKTEYCELQFDIDKNTAETNIVLLGG